MESVVKRKPPCSFRAPPRTRATAHPIAYAELYRAEALSQITC
jgi:hypothetical protein